jgi:hypothetical protein
VGSIAAGLAAFSTGFAAFMWLTPDPGPANAGLPGERTQFAFNGPVSLAEPLSARAAFTERFSFDPAGAASPSLLPPPTTVSFEDRFLGDGMGDQIAVAHRVNVSFNDRFLGEGSSVTAPVRSAAAAPPATAPRDAAASSRASARSVVAQVAPKQPPAARFQLASASEGALPLAYAPSDAVKESAVTGSGLKGLRPRDTGPLADVDTRHTAIYDITARIVYLPNGRRLEAHSGLGNHMDDPQYAYARMTGPTPPNVYDLKLREKLFHGVRAIRLVPTDDSKMHGRSGILAHSYMLGPRGESNGCVSFSDYPAFLEAYLRGDVKRLVVVERLADAPGRKSASDWFSKTLKDIFQRS